MELSVVMPCLNEAETVETCVRKAVGFLEEHGIEVLVRNRLGFDSNTPGAGLGLIGLTERVDLAGGRLTHRTEKDVFILEAWLPWGQ